MSIVVPFKGKIALTWECVNSFITYGPKVSEFILLSNNSTDQEYAEIESLIQQLPSGQRKDSIKLLVHNAPFNYQEINNWAIKRSTGNVVMLLNNDIELVESSRGLIEYMYQEALKPETGEVGCVLLFGDRSTIQHAGVYLIPGGTADAIYSRLNFQDTISLVRGVKNSFDFTRDQQVTAVTGAAAMVTRAKFEEVGRMDERFIICGGDVALGIELDKKGYKNILVGSDHGYMLHKESISRKHIPIPYNDFIQSYRVYVEAFDLAIGDPYAGTHVNAGKI